MKRYGSLIGLRPEALDEYKKYHAAVWPEVLAMIQKCNIRNYSIFLKDGLSSVTSNITARIIRQTWRKWRPIRKRRSGGPS